MSLRNLTIKKTQLAVNIYIINTNLTQARYKKLVTYSIFNKKSSIHQINVRAKIVNWLWLRSNKRQNNQVSKAENGKTKHLMEMKMPLATASSSTKA